MLIVNQKEIYGESLWKERNHDKHETHIRIFPARIGGPNLFFAKRWSLHQMLIFGTDPKAGWIWSGDYRAQQKGRQLKKTAPANRGGIWLLDFTGSQRLQERNPVSDIAGDDLFWEEPFDNEILSNKDSTPNQNREQKRPLSCLDGANDLAESKHTNEIRQTKNNEPKRIEHIFTTFHFFFIQSPPHHVNKNIFQHDSTPLKSRKEV